MFRNLLFLLLFFFLVSSSFSTYCDDVYSNDLDVFFCDDFESSDFLATNDEGFDWTDLQRISIVTQHPQDGNVVVNNGNPTYNVVNDGRNWEAKDGNYSMRFRYPVGQEMTELRFDLIEHYEDLWLSYWVRVPVNFEHGSLNNKFLSIWPETYDREGTLTLQTRPGTLGANLVYQDGGVTSGETDPTHFIDENNDLGRWMNVIVNVVSASSSSSNDGLIRVWRKWENESSFSLIHEKTNANTWDDTSLQQGISKGYFMGWANDPYTQDTEWLFDNVFFSTSSLLDLDVGETQLDSLAPSQVTGLSGVSSSSQVNLTWDIATDNVGVIFYIRRVHK